MIQMPSLHCALPLHAHHRSALVAASHVLRSLPPAALAGALLSQHEAGTVEHQLVARLDSLQAWLARVAATDADRQCAALAAACVHMQGQLAAEARDSLCVAHVLEPQLAGGGGLAGRGLLPFQAAALGGGGPQRSLPGIQVPGVGRLS